MLSFSQLSERKTKIKINPKKDEIVEGQKKKKDDSYLETNMKKRQANNEKARKDMEKMGTSMKNPHFESTNQEESAYDSQEEVSEESNQEIEAETEIPFLTFDQYQHAQTLDEEQLNEFLQGLFGGGKKPANANGAAKPSLSDRAVGALQNKGRAGGLGAPVQRMLGRNDATAAAIAAMRGRSKGGKVPAKVKKEEVGEIDEMMTGKAFGALAKGNKMLKQTVKPGAGNALGVQSAATSAGGGKYFTNNARLLARNPATYIRGNVPEPPKSAPKVNSSKNAVRPGMGSSSSQVGTASTTAANKPITSSASSKATNAVNKKTKKMPEQHIRSFGSFLKERTRYAKETGKDFTTGNPSEKGGEGRSEVGKHMQKVMRPTGGAMSSRKKAIQPQGKKKEKGKKGLKGVTPVDKIKNQLARKRAPKKDPYGYGQGRYQGD